MEQTIHREVLRAEHVAKRFGQVTALRDINLRLNRGEVLGLLGDNGAGKSTLVKIFTGYLQPTSGQLYLDGGRLGDRQGLLLRRSRTPDRHHREQGDCATHAAEHTHVARAIQ